PSSVDISEAAVDRNDKQTDDQGRTPISQTHLDIKVAANEDNQSLVSPPAPGERAIVVCHVFGAGLGFLFRNYLSLSQIPDSKIYAIGWLGMGGGLEVRILTRQLMPAYADRLHFKTLQGDMISIVWQVMATFSRMYLAIIGTIIIAAAGYKVIMELSQAVLSSANLPNSNGIDLTYTSFFSTNTASTQSLSCAGEHRQAVATPNLPKEKPREDDDIHLSAMDWALAQSTIVQCAA
ncbi:hypothetical protein BGZ46_002374, partial [Entomortierella lignicola]